MALLKRVSDGKGDSGARVEAITWNDDGTVKEIVDNKPVVGCSLLVGSIAARTYSSQDYWLTTEILEILNQRKLNDTTYYKFRTQNSEYEL